MKELVLASASASRQRLLTAAGVTYRAAPADLNETALMADLLAQGADAATVATALAEQKAVIVSRRAPYALVLGGDSVLSFGAEMVSKSSDLVALRALLLRLSGRGHELISAVCLARDGVVVWRHTAHARLTMRVLSPAFLDAYLVAEGEAVLTSVGGYRFEGLGAQLFERVDGDYFTILGLPLLPVLAALRGEGVLAS